jgi:hypothetical protein
VLQARIECARADASAGKSIESALDVWHLRRSSNNLTARAWQPLRRIRLPISMISDPGMCGGGRQATLRWLPSRSLSDRAVVRWKIFASLGALRPFT